MLVFQLQRPSLDSLKSWENNQENTKHELLKSVMQLDRPDEDVKFILSESVILIKPKSH